MQDEKLIELIAANAPQPPALRFDDVLARIEKQNTATTAGQRPRKVRFAAVAAIAAAAVVLIGLSAVVLPLVGGLGSTKIASEAAEESAEMQYDDAPHDDGFYPAVGDREGMIPTAATDVSGTDATSGSDLPAEEDETDGSAKHEKSK